MLNSPSCICNLCNTELYLLSTKWSRYVRFIVPNLLFIIIIIIRSCLLLCIIMKYGSTKICSHIATSVLFFNYRIHSISLSNKKHLLYLKKCCTVLKILHKLQINDVMQERPFAYYFVLLFCPGHSIVQNYYI